HLRGLGDEPLRAARESAGLPIAPEVIAGLARREADAVARGIRALCVRPAAPREDQQLAHVDEREGGYSRHHIFHEQRNALGVVDQIRFSCSSYGDEPRLMYGTRSEKRKRVRNDYESV